MKTLFKTALLVLTLTLFSCDKDENNEPEGFYMTSKIDQTDFEAIPNTVKVDYYTDNGDFMTITGRTTDNLEILMIVDLQNYTEGIGTYNQDQVTFTFTVVHPTDILQNSFWSTLTPGAGGGTLTILEEDSTHLKGTFNFSPFHTYGNISQWNTSILVNNGKFNAKK